MVTAPFSLTTDPSQLSGMNPGNNPGGSFAGFLTPNPMTAMGGEQNPFAPYLPPGQRMPGLGNPVRSTATSTSPTPTTPAMAPGGASTMPAYSSPYSTSGGTSAVAGLTPGTPETSGNLGDIAKSLQHTYYGGAGTALAQFLQGGAGYNPAVAQALIAAMQPQFAKGQANLMEQFGAMGLGEGSPAALGLGDYEAQNNLEVGQLLSGLYEQSVQNYMQVLMGTAGHGVNFGQQLAQTAVGAILGNASVASDPSGTSVGF